MLNAVLFSVFLQSAPLPPLHEHVKPTQVVCSDDLKARVEREAFNEFERGYALYEQAQREDNGKNREKLFRSAIRGFSSSARKHPTKAAYWYLGKAHEALNNFKETDRAYLAARKARCPAPGDYSFNPEILDNEIAEAQNEFAFRLIRMRR